MLHYSYSSGFSTILGNSIKNSASGYDTIRLLLIVFFQSVATIGSTVTSVHHDVETMQAAVEEHKRTIEMLQNEVVRTYIGLLAVHFIHDN